MTKKESLSTELLAAVRKAQKDEETGALIYAYMAKREKSPENKKLLEQMSKDEKKHADVWKSITNENIMPSKSRIFFKKVLITILGFTFVVKSMEKEEQVGQATYEEMKSSIPEAAKMLVEERKHEKVLYNMLDEERLHYVGAMVLGLNDALVELTGAIAGVTFALANCKLVALTGIITGISATLSMAASNYLAEKADGNEDALKSSVYTGGAYLVTVVLMVLPYLLFPNNMYVAAFAVMIATVLLIIFAFNYYISVAKEQPFFKNFLQMAIVSISVAIISFGIGLLAKKLLGIDVM